MDVKKNNILVEEDTLSEDSTELDSDLEESEAHQELGQWLDQLQTLTNELDGTRPLASSFSSVKMDQKQNLSKDFNGKVEQEIVISGATGSVGAPSASSPKAHGQQPPVAVKPKVKPAVPPKPPIDTYRFSMANMEESTDVDLDSLLSELCALETQLNSNGPESLFGKWTSSTSSTNKKPPIMSRTPAPPSGHAANSAVNDGVSKSGKTNSAAATAGCCSFPTTATSNVSKGEPLSASVNGIPEEKIYPTGHHHQQQQHAGPSHQQHQSTSVAKVLPPQEAILQCRAQSPDNDSAYCDSASLTSSESILSSNHNHHNHHSRCRDSHGSSADSTRGSMTTPSPTQLIDTVQAQIRNVQEEVKKENLTDEEQSARVKAEKIKIALEKMKEASVKKLYIKVFSLDGSSKSVLVDERWTVDVILRQLAEKNHVTLSPTHSLVESYPDLFMERIFEDHEFVVENVTMWTRDSPNKLYFVERPDKYDMFYNPQMYLINETNHNKKTSYDTQAKQQLITEFFAPSSVQPPELAGILYLKSDGKKSWKKHYFVLRASGLYYYPKGKTKSSKDLLCLMQFETVQIYNGIGWKKKYKAPTDYGFALKHPRIQVKASKYVKYLCVEDERSYQRWMTGLRLAKNGRQLFENFVKICDYPDSTDLATPTSPASSATPTNGYCRDSVVMRPKSSVGVGNVDNISTKRHSTSSNTSSNNEQSSMTSSFNGGGKRNSRSSLIHVDMPRVPEVGQPQHQRPLSSTSTIVSPTVSYRSTVTSVDSSNGSRTPGGSDSKTPTPETQSVNGFDVDVTTVGTIKRQPPVIPMNFHGSPTGGRPSALPRLPLMDTTRQIHSVASSNGSVTNRYESLETLSLSGSADGAEPDSDEELPPPPPPCDLLLPSPSRQQMSVSLNTGDSNCLRTMVVETGNHVTLRSSRGSVDSQEDTASLGSYSSGGRARRMPPAPPKRHDATRLSTTITVHSPVSPTPSASEAPPSGRSSFSGEAPPHVYTNGGVPALPLSGKPAKPALPVKPKTLPPPPPRSPVAQQQSSGQHSHSHVVPAATDAFNSELQRAMQKRLLKMQEAEKSS